MNANRKQIAKNIARIIRVNPKKKDQLETVQSITWHMTSDDHLNITCELYRDHIVRYLIAGTMSSMTVTANTLTNELTRKRRGEEPWYTAYTDLFAEDILKEVEA